LTASASRPTAIVTGAGSRGPGIGNGRAIAALLARDRFDLVLVDRSESALTATVELVASRSDAAVRQVVGDVTGLATCERIVGAADGLDGALGALINNVGVFGREDGIAGADVETWGAAWHVNVTSMALLARFAIPAMAKFGGGAIANLASVAALAGTGTDSLFYSASKGGSWRSLASSRRDTGGRASGSTASRPAWSRRRWSRAARTKRAASDAASPVRYVWRGRPGTSPKPRRSSSATGRGGSVGWSCRSTAG